MTSKILISFAMMSVCVACNRSPKQLQNVEGPRVACVQFLEACTDAECPVTLSDGTKWKQQVPPRPGVDGRLRIVTVNPESHKAPEIRFEAMRRFALLASGSSGQGADGMLPTEADPQSSFQWKAVPALTRQVGDTGHGLRWTEEVFSLRYPSLENIFQRARDMGGIPGFQIELSSSDGVESDRTLTRFHVFPTPEELQSLAASNPGAIPQGKGWSVLWPQLLEEAKTHVIPTISGFDFTAGAQVAPGGDKDVGFTWKVNPPDGGKVRIQWYVSHGAMKNQRARMTTYQACTDCDDNKKGDYTGIAGVGAVVLDMKNGCDFSSSWLEAK